MHWEPLGKTLKVRVSKTHRFNTDTLLLADFSMPKPGWHCGDLGCGCGVVSLLWLARGKPGSVLALDLQEEAVGLTEESARANGLELRAVRGDLRQYKACLPHQGLDLAACNPPYFSPGTGQIPESRGRELARHGEALSLDQLAQAAGFCLKTGGRLCFCLPAGRIGEAMAVMRQRGLEPKRLRMVQAQAEKAPYLFLLECRKGGGTGVEVAPPLLLREADGSPSPEMVRIYGDYWTGGQESPREASV